MSATNIRIHPPEDVREAVLVSRAMGGEVSPHDVLKMPWFTDDAVLLEDPADNVCKGPEGDARELASDEPEDNASDEPEDDAHELASEDDVSESDSSELASEDDTSEDNARKHASDEPEDNARELASEDDVSEDRKLRLLITLVIIWLAVGFVWALDCRVGGWIHA